jgi:hypothetical protein
MSFFSSFVAVRGSRDEFREAFPTVWPRYRVEEVSGELNTWDEMLAWGEGRDEHLGGPAGSEVHAFTRDGDWAVKFDFSSYPFDEAEQLARPGERFGTAAAFATQGTAGFAGFRLFEGGTLRREIVGCDGKVETKGEPIPAERGIDIHPKFYLDQIWALQRALGLSFDFWDGAPGPFVAVRVVDTTAPPAPPRIAARKRPWWRFW